MAKPDWAWHVYELADFVSAIVPTWDRPLRLQIGDTWDTASEWFQVTRAGWSDQPCVGQVTVDEVLKWRDFTPERFRREVAPELFERCCGMHA